MAQLIKREVKIGIMAVIAIFVLYFGINFLKGIDIFSSVSNYYTSYENLGGLVPSTPVFIKGYKVGQVEKIEYDFSKQKPFIVKLSISKDIKIPLGSTIQLYDEGLLGGKAVQIIFSTNKTESKYNANDSIPSSVAVGLMTQIAGDLVPKIEKIAIQADSLLCSIHHLIENKNLKNSLSSLDKTTANFAEGSSQLKKILNNDLPIILGNVNTITTDFKQVSGNLKKVDFAATFANINQTISNLNLTTQRLNSNDGTIGLLLNNKDLYINLNNTVQSANNLLIDLKGNPKRYVHFSLFGSKQK